MNRVRAVSRSSIGMGQSMIEMAIMLPLLLLLLAGIIDIGRAFNSYIGLTNAAREGVRYASRFPHDTDGIDGAAINEAGASGITLSADQITAECWDWTGAAIACQDAKSGDRTRVIVEYTIPVVLGGILGYDTIQLRRAVTMVVFGLDVE